MFEPKYQDPGRYWDMIQRHKITQFYTALTAIRTLMRSGTDWVKKYDLSSLRVLGPINPEAWRWYHDVVGKKMCSIVNTFWQTETGCHMMTPLPYSAYLVSDKVRGVSKNNDDEQNIWESAAGRSFTEQKDTEIVHGEVKRGTKIICYLKEDESEFLSRKHFSVEGQF